MLSNYKYEVDIYYLPRTHWKRNFCFIFFTVSPKIITSANDFSIIVLNIVISVLIFVFSFIGIKKIIKINIFLLKNKKKVKSMFCL